MNTELPCFPLIQERFWNAIKSHCIEEKKTHPDFVFFAFPQLWGSTALGFDGCGGQAMTRAYTTVVQENCSGWCGVFFGNNLAYIVKRPNQRFFEDIHAGEMKSVADCGVYN